MSKVYFKQVLPHADVNEIRMAAASVLTEFLEREKISLENKLPLKVHFGEKGNRTYLSAETYDGIIDLLQQRNVECSFIETSVLYGGERFNREKHVKLAKQHGFTRLPIVIADGAHGEDAQNVEVNLKHFKYCSVSKAIAETPQILVLSHFKGHALAGFGGAIKQLSMGCAAKGGKMAMHLNVKPVIWNWLCKKCKLCQTRCQQNAITIDKKSFIDPEKCIGCGACFSICPHHAVSIFSIQALKNALFHRNNFREKLVEYAYAAHHGKKNIYLTFATSVTPGCDCEPRPMRPCVDNIGIFVSADPVAIDTACYDAVAAAGKKFKGVEQLSYAEKIGLGSRQYELIKI